MKGCIVALFGSSILAVSMTIPSVAQEASGTVVEVDSNAGTLALDDGSRYAVPDHLAVASLAPGMQVHLLFVNACA